MGGLFTIRRTLQAQTEPPPDRAHPLEAIPSRHENVEHRESPGGDIHLRGRFPRDGFLARFMGRFFESDKIVQVVLDEKGSFFWSLIDGRRSLFEIAGRFRSHFDLEDSKSREATVLFVKMLMRRGFIRLKLPPNPGGLSAPHDNQRKTRP
jgi:Coenzyme PQQ synthesis protein D (PqqD)